MANFARVVGNVAVDVSTDPEKMFHPTIAAEFVPVPDIVVVGWIKKNDNSWSAPASSQQPAAEPIYPIVGVIAFKMLFTQPERIKSDELRASVKEIDDFWKLIDDPRTDIVNLNLESVQAAVEGTLTAIKAAGVEVDVPARKAAILSGVLK